MDCNLEGQAHKMKDTCKCGANCTCQQCGYGQGAIPCACTPAPEIHIVPEEGAQ